ncbi:MAG: sensor histidine kinase [Mucilaginibacter sp.]
MATQDTIIKEEVQEHFPFLLWAGGLAAVLVIGLTVVAFYFGKVQRDAQQTQSLSSSIIHLTDSISLQLQPLQNKQKLPALPFERLRLLVASDDRMTKLAESIFRQAMAGDAKDDLLYKLENLHSAAIQMAATDDVKVQAERNRLEATMIVLAALTLIVISFFTGISLGELKHRYKAYRKEKELNTMKSHFISVASHEFRTPLSSIQLCVSLIDKYTERGDSENVLKQGKKIRATIANLTAILEDFLSLEKLETGKITASYQCFDLPALCSDIIDEIKVIAHPDQLIQYEWLGTKETVNLDKNLLRNSILNLLSNAVKYAGEPAKILLHTNIAEHSISIRVTDNGKGIPPDKQKDLFTPFFRVDANTSIPGTGLGLNIVKKYAELMNGRVNFFSVPHKETTFELNFPVRA